MKKINLSEAASLLKSHDNFYILTHKFPDGDTIGCAHALCKALRKIGKKANVLLDKNVAKQYSYMTDIYKDEDFSCEYVVSVDVAAEKLLADVCDSYKDKIDLCIDHHGSNSLNAEYKIVDANAGAACEIVFEIIKLLSVEIDKEIANAIYAGIVTDTGCFRYQNTTVNTHKAAIELMPLCDWEMINKIHYETKSRNRIALDKLLYESLEYYCDNKCAIMSATLDIQKKANAGADELEGIAGIPRTIEGVKIGITIREKEDGVYKISVRTNDGVDAAKYCEAFGGGGHVAAAGCTITDTLDNVKAMLVKRAEESL